jgi:hypothetical protein
MSAQVRVPALKQEVRKMGRTIGAAIGAILVLAFFTSVKMHTKSVQSGVSVSAQNSAAKPVADAHPAR